MLTRIFNGIFNRLPLPVYPFRMYMHKHKCIFIHVPKNAGSSILLSLGHSGGRDHVEWRHYRAANPRWFDRYHKFAICRHPAERLYSAYRYALRGGNGSEGDLLLKDKIAAASTDFESFLENVIDQEFIQENILFKPQYLFLYDHAFNCKIDTLLRFESLDEDWRNLAADLGLPFSLGKANVGQDSKQEENIMASLSPLSTKTIKELYRKDFELFSYQVDG